MMSVPRSLWNLLLALFAIAAMSCGPLPTGPGPESGPAPSRVARVEIISPGVLVNDNYVSSPVSLYEGDSVRTDGSGRARILFNVGGSLTLGPNTDPLLKVVTEIGCLGERLVVYIRTGTFDFNDVSQVCFCDTQDDFCGSPESDFRVVINNSGASLTVTRGAVVVTIGRPIPRERFRVAEGNAIQIQGGKTRGPQTILR